MTKKVLSPTVAQRIVGALKECPASGCYVNELVRKLNVYPNSITQALTSLKKANVVVGVKRKNKIFYYLSPNYNARNSLGAKPSEFGWIKLLTRRTSFSLNAALLKANSDHLNRVFGVVLKRFWYNSITGGVYFDSDELNGLGEAIASSIKKDPSFVGENALLCRRRGEALVKFARTIDRRLKSDPSSKNVLGLLVHFYEYYLNALVFMLVPHSIERYLVREIESRVTDEDARRIFLEPSDAYDEQTESALRIALHIVRHGKDATYEHMLEKHARSYAFLPMWALENKPYDKSYFKEQIDSLLSNAKSLAPRLEDMLSMAKRRKALIAKEMKRLKLDRVTRDYIFMMQEYISLRTYRRIALTKSHYLIQPLLDQIAQQLSLSMSQVYLLSFEEMIAGLKGSIQPDELALRSNKRKNGWALLLLDGTPLEFNGPEEIIAAIERYRIMGNSVRETDNSISGRSVSKGVVKGVARIVLDARDLDRVQDGDILVTKMTTPEFVPAMNRAAGIITDEGGVTCHAAIVSRELGVPCIVGTKDATAKLKDGDLVQLDANSGIVRVLSRTTVGTTDKVVGKKAYAGKVFGRAHVAFDATDFKRIKDGDVLIAKSITPEFLTILHRVSGIVVEEDSLTSHTALYSKALKIPAIIAAKDATQIFKDDDNIYLNATQGYARKDKRHTTT